jgi:hypothetical protein
VLEGLLVLKVVLAAPFDFGQLRVIDTLVVPVGVLAQEVPPAAIGFFILASCGIIVLLDVLNVGTFHNQLVSEEARVKSLLSSALQLVRVVNSSLEECRQPFEFAASALHFILLDGTRSFHQLLELVRFIWIIVFGFLLRGWGVWNLQICDFGEAIDVGRLQRLGLVVQLHFNI